MSVDNQYVRGVRQHIPFYKDPNFTVANRNRQYWHHLRDNCEAGCVWGIPIYNEQMIMFYIEDDAPTDISMKFTGGGTNSIIQLCCVTEGLFSNDPGDCNTVYPQEIQGKTFSNHRLCVREGQLIQKNYVRIQLREERLCGLYYFKILAYDTESASLKRVYYSQPVELYSRDQIQNQKMIRLNIWDSCGMGGINWRDGCDASAQWDEIGADGGQEIWLEPEIRTSFIEKVTNEEVEEDDLGNEIPIFETIDWKYQFDSGFVPDHYAEYLHELAFVSQKSITMRDNTATGVFGPSVANWADHEVPIKRVETEMTPDGDGCYMNVNVKFLINKYNKKSCCDAEICECPTDAGLSALSYTTNQDDAEVNVEVGDTYIVPLNGPAPNNPDWATHDNEIAIWDGSGWVYSPYPAGLYYYVEDAADYYISLGPGFYWVAADLIITNMVESGACYVDTVAVLPEFVWAKIQISPSGAGTWTDLNSGQFYSQSQWAAGVAVYVGTAANWDFRLVPIDTGCGLDPSPIYEFTTTINCV